MTLSLKSSLHSRKSFFLTQASVKATVEIFTAIECFCSVSQTVRLNRSVQTLTCCKARTPGLSDRLWKAPGVMHCGPLRLVEGCLVYPFYLRFRGRMDSVTVGIVKPIFRYRCSQTLLQLTSRGMWSYWLPLSLIADQRELAQRGASIRLEKLFCFSPPPPPHPINNPKQ